MELTAEQKSQRKVRNLLLQPLLQVKLGLYSIILSVAFALIFSFVFYTSFQHLFDFILDLTDAREQVMLELTAQFRLMCWWLAIILIAYVGLVIVISIGYTHKLVGPTIAFRRHIRNLIEGRYQSRVTLRKNDAFAEVAEELNLLAELMEKKK